MIGRKPDSKWQNVVAENYIQPPIQCWFIELHSLPDAYWTIQMSNGSSFFVKVENIRTDCEITSSRGSFSSREVELVL